MSWLLAEHHPRLDPSDADALAAIHSDSPLHVVRTEYLYLATGGLDATCRRGAARVEGSEYDWIVLGMAFGSSGDESKLLDADDWARILSSRDPALSEIDGHFVVVRWNASELECFNDQLGMRTMHVSCNAQRCIVSTRLDWIAARAGTSSINFGAFGAHWLLTNQMTSAGLLNGIDRLGPCGRFRFNTAIATISETPWVPRSHWIAADDSDIDPVSVLERFVQPLNLGRAVSLGLSGGLDSRVLLALLLSRKSGPIITHVFGDTGDPDVIVSHLIARREGVEQLHLNDALPDIATCVEMLRHYVGWSCAIEPASGVTTLRYYPHLESLGRAVLDGGLGEIARRSYLKRLLLRGRNALHNRDADAMYPFVHIQRADVFNDDAMQAMRRGAVEEIASMLSTMPDPEECGYENFVDLMAVRTRFPYFAGLEQARTDASVLCYMPFAQPSFLCAVLSKPSSRRGGRMFRSIIHDRAQQLERYPLVKGGVAMPYSMPPLVALAWARARSRMRARRSVTLATQFLDHMEVFVRDTASSSAVRTFAAYDVARIQSIVDGYYSGARELAPRVNWWLAFEMWRQGIG